MKEAFKRGIQKRAQEYGIKLAAGPLDSLTDLYHTLYYKHPEAIAALSGAGLGAAGGAAISSPGHKGNNALNGAILGGGAGFAGGSLDHMSNSFDARALTDQVGNSLKYHR